MCRKIPELCRALLPGPAARVRRVAGTLAGAAALAACVLATTAAAPAAAHHPGHPAQPGPARHAPASAAIPKWIRIAAGSDHTCGIREGNTLWCWGSARFGELGTGAATDQNLPQQIRRPTARWASVTAGHYHTCATRSDGTLWCWGYNPLGQLGIGTTTSVSRPHQVTSPAPGGWSSVAAGGWHTCATRSDGTLWCWGYNYEGQLGTGSTVNQDQPQQVTTPAAGWSSVTAGYVHTCATRSDSTLWCWGDNGYGQLGTGSTVSRDQPQQVTTPAAAGWTSVTAGTNHTCALRTHALRCWGDNYSGQLGTGITATIVSRPRPLTTPTPTGWSRLATGGYHTCAIRTGHALWCWGDNYYGQLGLGSTTEQDLPQQVTS